VNASTHSTEAVRNRGRKAGQSMLWRSDQEYRLSGDAPIAQLWRNLQDFPPIPLHSDLGFQRPVGDQLHQQREIRREPFLGFRRKIAKALQPRVRRTTEIGKIDGRGFSG
jgi:hypothetical protein